MLTLVTGATGLVGNNVVRSLLARGERVRVLVRPTSDARCLDGLDVEVVPGDVRNSEDVSRAVSGAESIVHAAAWVHIGWSGYTLARAINVHGSENVADAAFKNGIRMVHVSSVDTVGLSTNRIPSDESAPPGGKPNCPYVATKIESEQLVLSRVQRGLQAIIVNPGFMLGPWDWKPSSGRMLLAIAKGWKPVTPVGGCSVCDVRDVVDAIIAARSQETPGERYILAGENISYYKLWREIAHHTRSWSPLIPAGPLMRVIGGKIGDILGRVTGCEPDLNSASVQMSNLCHYYSSDRARTKLNYRNRSLKETIVDSFEWFRAQGYLGGRL